MDFDTCALSTTDAETFKQSGDLLSLVACDRGTRIISRTRQ